MCEPSVCLCKALPIIVCFIVYSHCQYQVLLLDYNSVKTGWSVAVKMVLYVYGTVGRGNVSMCSVDIGQMIVILKVICVPIIYVYCTCVYTCTCTVRVCIHVLYVCVYMYCTCVYTCTVRVCIHVLYVCVYTYCTCVYTCTVRVCVHVLYMHYILLFVLWPMMKKRNCRLIILMIKLDRLRSHDTWNLSINANAWGECLNGSLVCLSVFVLALLLHANKAVRRMLISCFISCP